MNSPQTTREALLVEALGEIGALLDRVEAVAQSLSSAAEAVDRTCQRLETQAAAAQPRMAQVAQHAQDVAAKYIARSSLELMHSAADAEFRSMAAFASALFKSELHPALESLRQSANASAASHRQRCASWGMCAAAATASALLTGGLTLYLLL